MARGGGVGYKEAMEASWRRDLVPLEGRESREITRTGGMVQEEAAAGWGRKRERGILGFVTSSIYMGYGYRAF